MSIFKFITGKLNNGLKPKPDPKPETKYVLKEADNYFIKIMRERYGIEPTFLPDGRYIYEIKDNPSNSNAVLKNDDGVSEGANDGISDGAKILYSNPKLAVNDPNIAYYSRNSSIVKDKTETNPFVEKLIEAKKIGIDNITGNPLVGKITHSGETTTVSAKYMYCDPNGHFFTDINQILEVLRLQDQGNFAGTDLVEYLKTGLRNSLKNNYNIQKINTEDNIDKNNH